MNATSRTCDENGGTLGKQKLILTCPNITYLPHLAVECSQFGDYEMGCTNFSAFSHAMPTLRGNFSGRQIDVKTTRRVLKGRPTYERKGKIKTEFSHWGGDGGKIGEELSWTSVCDEAVVGVGESRAPDPRL